MNILLLGSKGQLGNEIERALCSGREGVPGQAAFRVEALDYPEIDLADEKGLRRIVREIANRWQRGPRGDTDTGSTGIPIIINAAAYTAVDRAESEPSMAMAVNGRAPGILAEEAGKAGSGFIHFSTDYVFDGKRHSARQQEAEANLAGGQETGSSADMGYGMDGGYIESDPPNPLNTYGKTKLAGELAVEKVGGAYLIFRTAWVYGVNWSGVRGFAASEDREPGFVTKVLRWARESETLKVVSDQISNPTWSRALAAAITRVVETARTAGFGDAEHELDSPLHWLEKNSGLYHLAGDGLASRLEWARAILELDPRKEEQKVRSLLPARTSDFPAPAARPPISALDCTKFERTFGFKLPPWRDSLRKALDGKVTDPR